MSNTKWLTRRWRTIRQSTILWHDLTQGSEKKKIGRSTLLGQACVPQNSYSRIWDVSSHCWFDHKKFWHTSVRM
jgi:hypothetical protein